MFLTVVYIPLYRLATVRTAQNRTFWLEKAERFSCTYYCLSLFLARLRFFGYTSYRPFSSTLLCFDVLVTCTCPRTDRHSAQHLPIEDFSYLAPARELTTTAHCRPPIKNQTLLPSYLHNQSPSSVAPQHHSTPPNHLHKNVHSFILPTGS